MIKVDTKGNLEFEGDWMCTDPDNHQFCEVVDEHTFHYVQLKECSKFYEDAEHSKNLLEDLKGRTKLSDWYEETIDVDLFSEEDVKEALEPYGGILDNVSDKQDRNQIVAECLFEQDVVFFGG